MLLERTLDLALTLELADIVASTMPGHGGTPGAPEPADAPDAEHEPDDESEEQPS